MDFPLIEHRRRKRKSWWKKLKLPSIKLPSLKKIAKSSLGQMIGGTLSTVGELAIQNAPTLLNFASSFTPMGSMTSKILSASSGILGKVQTKMQAPVPLTAVPQYPPGHPKRKYGKIKATPEQAKAIQSINTKTWRVISDKVAIDLQTPADIMWARVVAKFEEIGAPIPPLL